MAYATRPMHDADSHIMEPADWLHPFLDVRTRERFPYVGNDGDEETTPVAYARRVRMDRAHQALQAADPERDTVPAIAARWGFPDPHRFATDYEQADRQSPGAVLRG